MPTLDVLRVPRRAYSPGGSSSKFLQSLESGAPCVGSPHRPRCPRDPCPMCRKNTGQNRISGLLEAVAQFPSLLPVQNQEFHPARHICQGYWRIPEAQRMGPAFHLPHLLHCVVLWKGLKGPLWLHTLWPWSQIEKNYVVRCHNTGFCTE